MSAGWQGPTTRRHEPDAPVVALTRLRIAVGRYLANPTTGNQELLRAAHAASDRPAPAVAPPAPSSEDGGR